MDNQYIYSISPFKTTLFNASAGSGKTFTLVNVLAHLIFKAYKREHASFEKPLKHFLATTFTNAAATEMKERVLSFFAELVEGQVDHWQRIGIAHPTDTDLNIAQDIFGDILHHYKLLNISTIDSFFKRLALGFSDTIASQSGDIDVRIDDSEQLEDAKSRYLYTVNQQIDDYPLFGNILESYVKEDKKPSTFLNQYISQSLLQYQDSKFEKYRSTNAKLTVAESYALLEDLSNTTLEITSELCHLAKIWGEIYTLNQNAFNATKSKTVALIASDYQKIVEQKIDDDKWNTLMNGLVNKAFLKKNETFDSAESESQFYALGGDMVTKLLHLTVLQEAYLQLQNDLIGIEVYHYLNEHKSEQNIFTLQDLSKKLHDLVTEQGFYNIMYERTALRYHHYFIDEFQDTSHGQWNNFKPLIDNLLSGDEDIEPTAMLVGDGKQAIYRFRGGDISNFNSVLNDTSNKVDVMSLSNNFRSYPVIIDFVKDFFFEHFIPEIHLNDQLAKVYQDKPTTLKPTGGMVSIHHLTKESETSWEALMVEQIKKLLDQGIHPSQIAILCFTRNEIKSAIQHLREAGIQQVSSADRIPIQQFNEVQLTFLLWKFLFVKRSRVNLYHFLELYIRTYGGNILAIAEELKATHNYLDILQKYITIDVRRADTAVQIYTQILFCCRCLNLYDHLYVQYFLSLIRDLHFNDKTPDKLVQLWADPTDTFWQVQTEFDAESIRLYTIHMSKGLQFDYVFIPNPTMANNPNQDNDQLWLDTAVVQELLPTLSLPSSLKKIQLGKVAKWQARLDHEMIRETIPTSMATEVQHQMDEKKSETINAYYVALTRAVRGLFIISKDKAKQTKLSAQFNHLIHDFVSNSSYEHTVIDEHHHQYTKGWDILPNALEQKQDTSDHVYASIDNKTLWQPKNYESSPEALWGKAVHMALEYTKTESDLPLAIQHTMSIYTTVDRTRLNQVVLQTIQHPILAPLFFSDQIHTVAEAELISPHGLSRIDRYAIQEGQVYLLDFKTGVSKPEDGLQMSEYVRLMEQMDLDVVSAYIYYIATDELIDIKNNNHE